MFLVVEQETQTVAGTSNSCDQGLHHAHLSLCTPRIRVTAAAIGRRRGPSEACEEQANVYGFDSSPLEVCPFAQGIPEASERTGTSKLRDSLFK